METSDKTRLFHALRGQLGEHALQAFVPAVCSHLKPTKCLISMLRISGLGMMPVPIPAHVSILFILVLQLLHL